MRSIQQVLWRGALALGLMAVGLGSGIGMPPVERSASPADCPLPARVQATLDQLRALLRNAYQLEPVLAAEALTRPERAAPAIQIGFVL